MNRTYSEKSIHNYGIDILRIVLTLEVVLCHFWSPNGKIISKIVDEFRSIAAPTFFILSFYFTSRHLLECKQYYILKRIKRLIAPFFFWGIVAWIVYAKSVFSFDRKNKLIMSLFWQLTTGHGNSINPPLWYMAVLAWLTLAYFLVFKIIKNNRGKIVFIVTTLVVAFLLQYSGINLWLFGDLEYEIRYPLGRIIEMVPYASAGIGIWIINNKYYKRNICIILGIIGMGLYLIFSDYLLVDGFGYSGVLKLIGASSTLLLFLAVLDCRLTEKTIKLINIASKNTLGIYCSHFIIGSLLKNTFIARNNILLCICIYIICYILSLGIERIPKLKDYGVHVVN